MREEIYSRIIDYIRTNRVSTTEVADCLGKNGVLEGIYALNRGHFRVGRIKYLFAVKESNWDVHKDLQEPNPDKIVLIDAMDVNGRAVIGDLVSKYILLYQGSQGIVTNGKMRDAHILIKENYPIWCAGVSPVGCFNQEVDVSEFEPEIAKRREYYEGSIAVCDDSGVVVVPPEQVAESFYEKIVKIEEQEDIWYDCIDRRKWSTYKTICQKEYLHDNLRDGGKP